MKAMKLYNKVKAINLCDGGKKIKAKYWLFKLSFNTNNLYALNVYFSSIDVAEFTQEELGWWTFTGRLQYSLYKQWENCQRNAWTS